MRAAEHCHWTVIDRSVFAMSDIAPCGRPVARWVVPTADHEDRDPFPACRAHLAAAFLDGFTVGPKAYAVAWTDWPGDLGGIVAAHTADQARHRAFVGAHDVYERARLIDFRPRRVPALDRWAATQPPCGAYWTPSAVPGAEAALAALRVAS